MNPLISVIIPIYNTEKYLSPALESIFAQTYTAIEVICIDDGSTDKTPELLCEFQKKYGNRLIILTNEKKSGIAFSRNRGIRIAQGEYIAFMDADDISQPERFEKQLAAFQKDPNLDICFTMMECFISPELPDDVKALRHCPIGPQSGAISPTVMIRKSAFATVGLLDETMRVAEFVDWMSRADHAGLKQVTIDSVLFLRRIHDTNIGVVDREARTDYLKAVREALARKRESQS